MSYKCWQTLCHHSPSTYSAHDWNKKFIGQFQRVQKPNTTQEPPIICSLLDPQVTSNAVSKFWGNQISVSHGYYARGGAPTEQATRLQCGSQGLPHITVIKTPVNCQSPARGGLEQGVNCHLDLYPKMASQAHGTSLQDSSMPIQMIIPFAIYTRLPILWGINALWYGVSSLLALELPYCEATLPQRNIPQTQVTGLIFALNIFKTTLGSQCP